jgi:nitrogen fixation/metabolism regulation signal transduction histidine kinase
MKLKSRYIIFAVIVHTVLILLSLVLLQYNKWLFLIAELLIGVSIAATIQLYRAFLKPLELLSAGVDSIKDRDFSSTFVETGHEELDRLINVYNRMIDQLRRERIAQREQHYFLERLIEAVPIGVVILDLDERVSMLNRTAREILQIPPDRLLGCALRGVVSGIWDELSQLRSGETKTLRVSGMRTYRCRKSYFLDRGFHRHFILIEELTDEIIASQKHAYEKVIRMMSHETNNTVGAVNSILQSSAGFHPHSAASREEFDDAIRVAIERNKGLIQFMANPAEVVRIPPPSKQPYDLHELVRSAEVLMSSECQRRHIRWANELAPGPLLVEIDVHQMGQAIMNIVKNAVEAIDHDGCITVRTTFNPRTLCIIDDGEGFGAEALPNLFTPFFSTKQNGQGVGLTLVGEVLINHGFGFDLERSDNSHTVFRIDLDRTSPVE